MSNKKYNNFGFSLIEILVVMSILSLVIIIGTEFIITGLRSSTFGSEQETAIVNGRQAIEALTKEIRGANNSENGSYPLGAIGDQDLTFYSDINNDGLMEKARYYLDGTTLKKSMTLPGTARDYSGQASSTMVANYLNNQTEPLFFYFDRNYQETDVINNIRLINIKLKVNVTPERAPADYYVESDVNLRNLKDNL